MELKIAIGEWFTSRYFTYITSGTAQQKLYATTPSLRISKQCCTLTAKYFVIEMVTTPKMCFFWFAHLSSMLLCETVLWVWNISSRPPQRIQMINNKVIVVGIFKLFQLYFWRCGWTELKYSRYYSISFYTLKFRAFIFRSRLSLKDVILNYLAFKLLLFGKHIQNLLSFQNTDRDQIPCVCLLSVINTDMIFKILIFNKYIRIVL